MTEKHLHPANNILLFPSPSDTQAAESSYRVHELLCVDDTSVGKIDTGSFTFLIYKSFISEVFGDLISKKMEIINYNESDVTFTVGESEYLIEGIIGSGISMKELGKIIKKMFTGSKKNIFDVYAISIDRNNGNNRTIKIMFKNSSIISQNYQAVPQEIDPQIGM